MSPVGNNNLLQKGVDTLPLNLNPHLATRLYINRTLILKENILCFDIEPDLQTFLYHEPINVNGKLFYQGDRKCKYVLHRFPLVSYQKHP